MSNEILSDEELNAFVDGELNAADRARILTTIRRDPDLQQRVAALVQTRQLLRHAYDNPPAPMVARTLQAGKLHKAVAAAALFALGAIIGTLTQPWWHHQPSEAVAAHAAPQGIVIQMSEGDPAKWNLALINATNARKAYQSDATGVEIVAYGPGLGMLLRDSSVAGNLEEIRRQGIKLLACGNTMRMAQKTRGDLFPNVEVVPAGVVEIIEKQRSGYAYVRP